MFKQLCGIIIVLVLVIAFSSVSFAQDAAKKDAMKEQKMEMKKDAKEMGALKSLSCDDKCGFMVRSHDEKEIMSSAKAHIQKHHKEMKMTDKQIKEMVKTEEGAGMK